MPIGPKGEKRPADPVANALLMAKIATGEAEETYVSHRGQGCLQNGQARASEVSAERCSAVARKATAARWG